MKVGIVCPYDWSHPGGVKTHIRGLAGALERRGIETGIIAPASGNEPEIFSVGKPVPISYNGSIARLCFSPQSAARIRKLQASEEFDVLHVHEPAIPSISMLAVTAGKHPAVATFHAAGDGGSGYRAARPVLQSIMSRMPVRIAVSTAARDLISRHFPGHYEIIPNGIDYRRWAEAHPDPETVALKPVVLFVGRPEPRKGLDVFAEAMDIVGSRIKVTAVAVGPDPAHAPAWINAVGPVGSERLPEIMKAADVFCAPSLGGESFGIVLAEAMAAGVPVVCSDLPGYREAARGSALEVPAGNPVMTAEAILSVLMDQSRAAKLSELGSSRARELDWDQLSGQVIACYRKALGA